jgi:enoyl-CoA hydratase/carnithine racemase
MADRPLRLDRADGVVRCTLDRPPLNLLDPSVIAALHETFAALSRDASVRAVVVSGAGRAFTGGMDVHVLRDLDVTSAKTLISQLCAAIDAVHRAPFPVIAAVNGACLGAGFELALACDLRVATTAAVFGLPEVRVGVPSVIQAALLPPLIGPGRAAELLLLGTSVTAAQALEWGLVNRVVEAGALASAVDELLDALSRCAPGAVRLQKELIIRWRETDLPSAVQAGVNAFATAYATGEPREGAEAFLAKREPRFDRP